MCLNLNTSKFTIKMIQAMSFFITIRGDLREFLLNTDIIKNSQKKPFQLLKRVISRYWFARILLLIRSVRINCRAFVHFRTKWSWFRVTMMPLVPIKELQKQSFADVLQNRWSLKFAIFTRKHLCWSLILKKTLIFRNLQ